MRLIAMGFGDAGIGDSSTFEKKWAEHRASLQKREDDMRQIFVEKVSDLPSEMLHEELSCLIETTTTTTKVHTSPKISTEGKSCDQGEQTTEKSVQNQDLCCVNAFNDTTCLDESLIWDDYLDELRYPVEKECEGETEADTEKRSQSELESSIEVWEFQESNPGEENRKCIEEGTVENLNVEIPPMPNPSLETKPIKRKRCTNKRKVTFDEIPQEIEISEVSECHSMSESIGRVKMLASRFDTSFH